MRRLQVLLALGLSCMAVVGTRVASQTTPQGKLQRPEPIVKGVDLFKLHCAVCHGVDAKGDGPLAPHLKAMPANLTVLAKNNGGQFPAARVRRNRAHPTALEPCLCGDRFFATSYRTKSPQT
jgi:mono/diheme cytochrome c family protein